MKKKLRLLLTKNCDRNCEGCCNKQYDLDVLPYARSFKQYDEVLITGGEPMLYPGVVMRVARTIRRDNPKVRIYLYTAKVANVSDVFSVLPFIDGITLTLHNSSDIAPAIVLTGYLEDSTVDTMNKSYHMNIFSEVGNKAPFHEDHYRMKYLHDSPIWTIKDNMEWIEDCPLPEGEEFKRL